MRMHGTEPNVPGGTWGPPLVGFVGTVAGMLFAFGRIGTEPEWKTAVEAVGLAVGLAGISLIVSLLTVRSRH